MTLQQTLLGSENSESQEHLYYCIQKYSDHNCYYIRISHVKVLRMACHAARVIRQRHKAESGTSECEISPEQRKCLETAFEAADKNGDGILSVDEYYEIFQAHGLTIGKA